MTPLVTDLIMTSDTDLSVVCWVDATTYVPTCVPARAALWTGSAAEVSECVRSDVPALVLHFTYACCGFFIFSHDNVPCAINRKMKYLAAVKW